MKRCPSCGTEYDRAAWLGLPGRDWPALGLWLRHCVCGTILSVPMVGRLHGQRDAAFHTLYCVDNPRPVLRRTYALPSCAATGLAMFVLAPEGEEPSCAKCKEGP